MKPIEERVKEAQEKLIPILKELMVDVSSEPTFDKIKGTIGSQLIWIDTTPAAEEASPEVPADTK